MSVIGYRFWGVDLDGLLSPSAQTIDFRWNPDGPTEASCDIGPFNCRCEICVKNGDPAPAGHVSPYPSCRCGLYVHHKPIPDCVCRYPDVWRAKHGAVGVVRCWGRYARHETGTRWQYAQPVALVDFTGRLNPGYVKSGARLYPDLDAMYAEWADGKERTADVGASWHNEITDRTRRRSLSDHCRTIPRPGSRRVLGR